VTTVASLRIFVSTGRPGLGYLFTALGDRSVDSVSTTVIGLGRYEVARAEHVVTVASVAVVDASVDADDALGVCEELRTRRPELPIGILFCCPHAATLASLRPFLAMGIGSFVDLQLSAEQMLAALRGIARGETVVRLHLSEQASEGLFNGEIADEEFSADDLALLQLVALGSTDLEIGVQMCLSHHTVKHRIERLRRRLHARNRVQLAAYAGRMERAHSHGGSQWGSRGGSWPASGAPRA
jgi:DNA-binding NarL/FixJ family response regulator